MKKAVIIPIVLLSFGIAKAQNEISNDVHYQVIHFSNGQLTLEDTIVHQNSYSVDQFLADLGIPSDNLNLIELDGSMKSEAGDHVWVLPNNNKTCMKVIQEYNKDTRQSEKPNVTIKKMLDPEGSHEDEDIQVFEVQSEGEVMSQQEIEQLFKDQGIDLPEGPDAKMIVKTMVFEETEELDHSEVSENGQDQEETVDIQITKTIDENGAEKSEIRINGEEATQEELDAYELSKDIEIFKLEGNAGAMNSDSYFEASEHTVVVVSAIEHPIKSEKLIEEPSIVEGLDFSPNPSNGQFQLNFELKQKGKTKIEIRNIQGQLVYEENLGNIKGKYTNFIDISFEGAGTYILSVLQGNQRIAERIIVQ